MIEALIYIAFGQISAILLIGAGHIFHMRVLDRKLYKPYPKKPGGTP
jgi:hypothetical protein